jgi:hypothetical protein
MISRRPVNCTVIRLSSMNRLIAIVILVLAPVMVCPQKPNALPLGWDLTYKNVLAANHVEPDQWISKWLASTAEPPLMRKITTWKRGLIQSAILVDFPAPHAGERTTMWFVRTRTKAYYFDDVERNPHHETSEPLDTRAYDKLFDSMSSWQQAKPVAAEQTPDNGIPGYQGIVSFYNRGNSRQMLLTGEDFVICNDKKCEYPKLGRFWETMTSTVPRFNISQ